MNKRHNSLIDNNPHECAGEPAASAPNGVDHDFVQPGQVARAPSSFERVLSGGTWVVLGRGLSIIATVVMNGLLARDLSYEEFGAFFVARSLGAGLCLVAMLGWNSMLVRFVAESLAAGNVTRARQFIYVGCVILAISSAMWLIVLLGPCGQHLGNWLRLPHNTAMMPLLGIWMCLSAWHQVVGEGLRGCNLQQFANFSAGEMGGPIANAAFCLILLTSGNLFVPSLVSCIWANVVIQAVLLPLSAGLLWRACCCRDVTDAAHDTADPGVGFMVGFTVGVPLMLMHLVSFIAAQGDLWIVAKYCSTEDRAIFAAARRLTLIVTTPQVMANLAVLPTVATLFSQNKTAELQNILQKLASIASVVAVVAMLALLVRPDLTIELIFGADYRSATTVAATLVSGYIVASFAGASVVTLTMTGHHREVLWIIGASAIVLVSVGPFAAEAWGAVGVAIVAAIVVALQSVLCWIRVHQLIGVWTHPSWRAFYAASPITTTSPGTVPDAKA